MTIGSIGEATESYEAWLRRRISVVEEGLDQKHTVMAESPFTFLRATYYRWVSVWPELSAALVDAPRVLAVGDLHTENFGTWRDTDGRLAWGVNDFDEAHPLPYTSDLVRLATSALLAIKSARLEIAPEDACDAILAGYQRGLDKGARPFVLAERHGWLGDIARRELKDARKFWKEIEGLPVAPDGMPETARAAVARTLPDTGIDYHVRRRVTGAGGLGCPRLVALAHWQGSLIAREAKAVPPSAHVWAGVAAESSKEDAKRIAFGAGRAHDPRLEFAPGWRVRRLAPDCSKLDLADLPGQRDEHRLLRAMGKETANVHCGSAESIPAVQNHLGGLPEDWLLTAARVMLKAVRREWKEWKGLQKNAE